MFGKDPLDSTGRCNDGGQSIGGGLVAKRLARTAIEPSREVYPWWFSESGERTAGFSR